MCKRGKKMGILQSCLEGSGHALLSITLPCTLSFIWSLILPFVLFPPSPYHHFSLPLLYFHDCWPSLKCKLICGEIVVMLGESRRKMFGSFPLSQALVIPTVV